MQNKLRFIYFIVIIIWNVPQFLHAQVNDMVANNDLLKKIESLNTIGQFDSVIVLASIELTKENSPIIEAYLHKYLASAYLQLANFSFAEKEFNSADLAFEKLNIIEARVYLLLDFVDHFIKIGDYPAAQQELDKASSLVLVEEMPGIHSKVINYQGKLFWAKGDYTQAFRSQFSSLTYARLAKDSSLMADNYKDIGNSYYSFNNITLANEYYYKALEIYDLRDDFNGLANIYNNLGEVKRSESKYYKAVIFHLKAAEYDSLSNNQFGMAYDFVNLTEDYIKLNKLDSAIFFYKQSIIKADQTKNNYIKSVAYLHYGTICLKQDKKSECEQYYLKSVSLSETLQSQELKIKVYKTLENFYLKESNYKKAHFYSNKIYLVTEILNKKRLQKSIIGIEHLDNKINTEINELNKSTSQAKSVYTKQQTIIYVSVLLLLILGILVFIVFRVYKKMLTQNKQLAIQNKTIIDAEANLQLANSALKSMVLKFQNLVAHLPILVYGRDERGRVIFWNKEAEKTTLFNEKEILNDKEAFLKLIPDQKEQLELAKAMDKGAFKWIETTIVDKNKVNKRIAWSGVAQEAPVDNWHDWGIGLNISSRYRFEVFLERERAILNSIVNSIPYMIYYKNTEGVYLGANPAYKNFYGYDFDIVGKKDSEIYSEKETLLLRKKEDEIIQEKGTFSEEKWIYKSDRTKHLIHTLKFPFFNKQGEVLGIMGISRDITDRYEFEQELKRQKKKAEDSDNLKSAFLANMSHEIRTPLNAIIGFADLLKNTNLSVQQREKYVDYINNSGSNLLNLIDDIIDTAKIEAGQLKIRKGRVFINRLLDEILETHIEIRNNSKKEQVEIRLVKGISDRNIDLYTDSHRLRQVLANLINNAIKFVDTGFIEFGYEVQTENLLFYVKDTGIGIAKEKHEIIFERFGQVESSYKKNFQGTGLGLAITKKLVLLLGGKIWLESDVNKGSTFYFTIPYVRSSKDEEISGNQSNLDYDFTNKTILIAEDDRLNYIVLKNTLRQTNANLIWKHNGQEVIELMNSKKEEFDKIDLILMDVQMPLLNGYEATNYIRQKNENVPIIAVTAYALIGEREKLLAAGCNDYLSKPYKSTDLLQNLAKYLNNEKK